jgi:hypothetical protein
VAVDELQRALDPETIEAPRNRGGERRKHRRRLADSARLESRPTR